MMKYGRYLAEISYEPDQDSFYGRMVNVERGGFDFWGSSVEELRREFAVSAEVFEEFMAEKEIAFEVTDPPETKSQAARTLGRATSPAKAAAARKNGRKGGRPRKTPG